jgi:hypothetical protein
MSKTKQAYERIMQTAANRNLKHLLGKLRLACAGLAEAAGEQKSLYPEPCRVNIYKTEQQAAGKWRSHIVNTNIVDVHYRKVLALSVCQHVSLSVCLSHSLSPVSLSLSALCASLLALLAASALCLWVNVCV